MYYFDKTSMFSPLEHSGFMNSFHKKLVFIRFLLCEFGGYFCRLNKKSSENGS